MNNNQKLRIAFIHPDLGIGGAEQLVINLAVALQDKGHFVKIYTPYHDPNHCFPETINGTLKVEVRGDLIPAKIKGKLTALCAYIRMVLCTLWVIFYGGRYDVFIIDQVSLVLPLLKLTRRRSIFYCHFPDKLLCVDRASILKKVYRFFLDNLEEFCMFFADLILVNSLYTKDIVEKAFPIYNKLSKNKPLVLYPAIDFNKFDNLPPLKLNHQDSRLQKGSYFVSLNRYERKKNIALALHAFAILRSKLQAQKDENYENIKLVIAGGYEDRIQENKDHFDELNQIAQRQGISEYVSFKRNVSDEERAWLLQNCLAVLYTPEREHFGIVPVEAMYNQAPVIACNSGGPKESILDQETGYLCESKASTWCEKMLAIYQNEKLAEKLGNNGKARVIELFSFKSFQVSINKYVEQVCQTGQKKNKQI